MNRRGFLKGAVAGASLLMVPKALAIPGDKEFVLPNAQVMKVGRSVELAIVAGGVSVVPMIDGKMQDSRALVAGDILSIWFDEALI
jgi:hypothetical protein